MSAREPYETPTILRHVSGLTNKFGRMGSIQPVLRVEGVPVAELVEEHGSPVFVYSESVIRNRYRSALQTMRSRYPDIQFAWSYKTNYLDAICSIYHQEGSWAEVVSGFEYEKARRLGVPGNRIIFNGPYKTPQDLRRAGSEGALIQIDHLDEIFDLEAVAAELDQEISVGLRLNMDTGIHPRWDRFGFNLDGGQARDAVRRIVAGGRLKLRSLHSHLGTFILEPRAYAASVAKMMELSRRLEEEFRIRIEILDVGGGFASRNTLHTQYLPGEQVSPSFDQYAEAITGALLSTGGGGKLPKVILETGRALIDEAGTLIARVVATKRLPDGRRALVIDAGVNILFTAFWYRLEISPGQPTSGMPEESVVYGPLCMNIDVVRPSVSLPPLGKGDLVVIRPVGAYNVTQWMQFIRMRPRVVLIGPGGQVDVIRERESLEDLTRHERIPERLSFDPEEIQG